MPTPSMPDEHPAIELRRQLENSLIQRDHPNHCFISKPAIDRFWLDDNERLKAKLGLHDWDDVTLLDVLRKECRTIACILCWIQYNPYSQTLQEICQQSRPHEQPNSPPVWRDTQLPLSRGTCEALRGYQAGQLFYITQFLFTPIVISSAKKGVQEVHPERRWPYAEPPKDIGFGAYGRVFKVSVVKGHLKDTKDSSNDEVKDVACKKVEKSADWGKEVKNLDFLKESLSGHKRLILHLAAFIQSKNFYIFLPYTELGDLETFFREGTWQDENSADQEIYDFTSTFRNFTLLDLAREFANVIDATAFLHDRVSSVKGIPVFCAHADLRPQNILIFPGGKENPAGVWHISDFGISSVQLEDNQALPDPKWASYPSMGDIFEGRWSPSGTYSTPRNLVGPHVAPEMSINGILKPKQGDVWSLGCILTEVLVFSLGTSQPGSRRGKLEEFRIQRRSLRGLYKNDYFFDIKAVPSVESEFEVSIKRRSKVTEWLQWLYESKFDLYKGIAAVANQMLRPNPEGRCTAKDAYEQISIACNASTSATPPRGIPEAVSSQPQEAWVSPPKWRFQAVYQSGKHGSSESLTFVKQLSGQTDPTPASASASASASSVALGNETPSTDDNSSELNSPDSTQSHSFRRVVSTGITRPWQESRSIFVKPAINVAISHSQGIVVYLCKGQGISESSNSSRSKNSKTIYELRFRKSTEEPWTHSLPSNIRWQDLRAEGRHVIAIGIGSKSDARSVYIYDLEDQRDINLPDDENLPRMRKFLPSSSAAFIAHNDKDFVFWHKEDPVHMPVLPAGLGASGQIVFGSTGLVFFTWSCQVQGDTVIVWTVNPGRKPQAHATYKVPRVRGRPGPMFLIPCGSLPACILWNGHNKWFTASSGPTEDDRERATVTEQHEMGKDWPGSAALCVANERHFFFIASSKKIVSCDLGWHNGSTLMITRKPQLLSETSVDLPHSMALHAKSDGKYELIICNLKGAVESLEVEC